MDETLGQFGEMVAGALAGSVTGQQVAFGELTITAKAADIVKVATFLRDDERCLFYSFIDITAIDWPSREQRFDVVPARAPAIMIANKAALSSGAPPREGC
jgi:NADH-quinone oxidoreductase subunit C